MGNLAFVDMSLIDPRVNPLQRTLQLLCPILIGAAASTYRLSPHLLGVFFERLRRFSYVFFFGCAVFYVGTFLAGLPTGLAAAVMTAMAVSIIFGVLYQFYKRKADLLLVSLMIFLPVLAITRSVIAVSLLSLPLSFAPMKLRRRIFYIFVACACALVAFNLPQVQRKMFFSGQGSLADLTFDNPNFATSGRSALWEILLNEARQRPFFGHGTGGGETLTYAVSPVGYPHYAWLLTFFDFGNVGVCIVLFSNFLMLHHCLSTATRTVSQITRATLIASASTFIPFMFVMYTDNIMVYASYYGNIVFLVAGMGYAGFAFERVIGRRGLPSDASVPSHADVGDVSGGAP